MLTNEAMFTGWNPTGTEASLPIKARHLVKAGEQYTLNSFLTRNYTHSLGLHVYPLEDEDFPIFWYLQVTDRC